jgi:hypothetical protein
MKNLIGFKIKFFSVTVFNEVSIELNDGSKYRANLSKFNDIYCYPKNLQEWMTASIGECGADIEWESGFGVHLDQIANLASDQKTAS